MSNTPKSSRKQILKHLVTVGVLLMPVGVVHAQNCGCEASHSSHHHHQNCCPPGLLDRLNDLSDAMENSIKSLMPIRSKSCDGCGCDSCDHSSAQINHQHQHLDHQHAHPTSKRETNDSAAPQIDDQPFHSTPQKSNPESPRVPDWLSDPFKDESHNDRPTKIRSASMQTEQPEEESILLFDPQASHRHPSLAEQLFKMVSKKQTPARNHSSHAVQSRVAKPNPSMIVSEIICRHVSDNQLVKVDTTILKADRTTLANADATDSVDERKIVRDGTTVGQDEEAESEVVQASAFVPVYVAPIPRRN